jgi:hypothetical protein
MIGKTNVSVEAMANVEMALIGALLLQPNSDATKQVKRIITTTDFICDWDLRRIYNAICLIDGIPHEINVARKMAEIKTLKEGDCAKLVRCIADCPCHLDYLDYANTLKAYSCKVQNKPIIQTQREHQPNNYSGFEV